MRDVFCFSFFFAQSNCLVIGLGVVFVNGLVSGLVFVNDLVVGGGLHYFMTNKGHNFQLSVNLSKPISHSPQQHTLT